MHEKAEIAAKARIVMEIEIEIEGEGEAYFEVDLGQRGIVHIKAEKFEKVNVDTINARFGSNLTLKAIQQSKVVRIEDPPNPVIYKILQQYIATHSNVSLQTTMKAQDRISVSKVRKDIVKAFMHSIFKFILLLQDKLHFNFARNFISLEDIERLSERIFKHILIVNKRYANLWELVSRNYQNKIAQDLSKQSNKIYQQLMYLWRIIQTNKRSYTIEKQVQSYIILQDNLQKMSSHHFQSKYSKKNKTSYQLQIDHSIARFPLYSCASQIKQALEINEYIFQQFFDKYNVKLSRFKEIVKILIECEKSSTSFLRNLQNLPKNQLNLTKDIMRNFLKSEHRRIERSSKIKNKEAYHLCLRNLMGYLYEQSDKQKQKLEKMKSSNRRIELLDQEEQQLCSRLLQNTRNQAEDLPGEDNPAMKPKLFYQLDQSDDEVPIKVNEDQNQISKSRKSAAPVAAFEKQLRCLQHQNFYQFYCAKCSCWICRSCILGSHNGHEVSIEDGAKDLRKTISLAAEKGILPLEKTAVHEKINKSRLSLKEASEKYFDELISTLKTRKTKFLEELRGHFSEQIESIDRSEEEWLEKQEVSQRILKLQTSKDDLKLMEEASAIFTGLEALAKPGQNREIRLFERVKEALARQDVNLDRLESALKEDLEGKRGQ